MTDARALFDLHARDYDALRRRLIPSYDSFYGAAVGALALAARPPRRILDLGAGTGLLTRAVVAAHPDAAVTLFDCSPAMLEQARAALGDTAEYVIGDLADELPAGPWDAVVSALAIHHVADDVKRDLFERVHAGLVPGGVFVNAEQVSGPTAAIDDAHAAWHERRAAELGTTPDEWAAACERMRVDQLATLEDQLAWLRDAGFDDVDCLFKDHHLAVLVGHRTS